MEFLLIVIGFAVLIMSSLAIANWGASRGLRWGQVFLVGILVSPLISLVMVAIRFGSRANSSGTTNRRIPSY